MAGLFIILSPNSVPFSNILVLHKQKLYPKNFLKISQFFVLKNFLEFNPAVMFVYMSYLFCLFKILLKFFDKQLSAFHVT